MKRYNKCSGYDEGYDEGYDDGHDDGKQEAGDVREIFFRSQNDALYALAEEIDKRKRGAALPHPIYNDTMTLDEIEQLIRRL